MVALASRAIKAPRHFAIATNRPPRAGMDHAPPQRRDLLERGLHVGDGEVGQRSRVARTGAAFVNTEAGRPALALPAATLGFGPLGELDPE